MSVFDLQEIAMVLIDLKGKSRLGPGIKPIVRCSGSACDIHDILYLFAACEKRSIIVSGLRDSPHPFLACIGVIQRSGMFDGKTGVLFCIVRLK